MGLDHLVTGVSRDAVDPEGADVEVTATRWKSPSVASG